MLHECAGAGAVMICVCGWWVWVWWLALLGAVASAGMVFIVVTLSTY